MMKAVFMLLSYLLTESSSDVHEVTKPYFFSPDKHNRTTCILSLFVPDLHAVMNNAIKAGVKEISPVKDYEYGYRQGEIEDPFGHHWLIQKKIS
jgi:PhnB protein